MQEMESKFTDAADGIFQAKEDFRDAISHLDLEIKCKEDISVRAVRVTYKLSSLSQTLSSYSNFIGIAYAKYSALENYEQQIENVGNVTVFSPENEPAFVPNEITTKDDNTEIEQPKTQLGVLSYIKDVLAKGLKWFIGNLDNLMHLINKYVSKIKDKVDNKYVKIIADIVGLVTSAVESVTESIKKGFGVLETIALLFHDIFNYFTGLLNELMKNDDKDKGAFRIYKKISSVLEELQKTLDRLKQNVADAISELSGLIKSLGSLLGDIPGMNTGVKKGMLYTICGVLSMASSIVGDIMTYKADDDVLEGNEILQAVGDGLLEGLGTVGSLFLEDCVDKM